jgi:hypothetical protein
MPVRINDLQMIAKCVDPVIDNVPGVTLHRVFSVPLKDQVTGKVFAVVHMGNRTGNAVFTAADETLLKVFTHHLEWVLSACNVYTRTTSQSRLLQAMVRTSVRLADAILPPAGDMPNGQPPRNAAEILLGETVRPCRTA